MTELFGIPLPALLSQLLLGLVNGSFYAMLSLGLAVIFDLLNVINFAHGALYMMGAMFAWMGLTYFGLNYWGDAGHGSVAGRHFRRDHRAAVVAAPLQARSFVRVALDLRADAFDRRIFRSFYGVSGLQYSVPEQLAGARNLGFMVLPNYRAWVVLASLVVCFGTWYVIERTKLGALLRAGTENAKLTEAFGVNVPLMVTLTYGFGVALAAFAGVLAAPILQVQPLMGNNLIIVVFAVVVIGGMGSIMGSILTGLGLGVVEGFTRVFYPEASATVVFVIMAIVLLLRPAGLFGKEK